MTAQKRHNGVMTINMAKWPVADENCSGWICPMCGHNLTRTETLRMGRDLETCTKCDAVLDAATMPTKLLADAKRFADEGEVRATSWFHATLSPDWFDDVIRADAAVHVGTYTSALMRSLDLRDLDGLGHPENATWYIHEVMLDTAAVVMGDVVEDSDGNWPETGTEMVLHAQGSDAVRYLNKYEDPGSISLLASANALRVLTTRTFRAAEIDAEMAKIYA